MSRASCWSAGGGRGGADDPHAEDTERQASGGRGEPLVDERRSDGEGRPRHAEADAADQKARERTLSEQADARLSKPPDLLGYAYQLYAASGWTSAHYLHRLTQDALVIVEMRK